MITRYAKTARLQTMVICCAVVCASLTSTATGQEAPTLAGMRAALTQRDKAFSTLRFDWYVEHHTTAPGAIPEATKHWVQKAELTARKRAADEGVTDEAEVRKMIANERGIAEHAGSKTDMSYKCLHEFTRDGERTEAHATKPIMGPTPVLTTEWHQWYGNGWGAIYCDRSVDPHGQQSREQGPYIWREKGDGTMYNAPFIACLDITPGEFVLLTGKNPFQMYGDHWQTLADNPGKTVFRCTLTAGQLRNATVEMTLDKRHGSVPKLIIARVSSDKCQTYAVKRWKQYAGFWIPAEVDYSWEYHKTRVHRTWTLSAIGPGHPVKLDMPIGTQLADVRLLSEEPDFFSVMDALKPPNDKVAWYRWNGRLVDLAELAHMKQKDAAHTADWRNLLPGILLLACGGVWFIRTRAVSKRTASFPEHQNDA